MLVSIAMLKQLNRLDRQLRGDSDISLTELLDNSSISLFYLFQPKHRILCGYFLKL